MKDIILKKKINGVLIGFLLYITFCMANYLMARGELGYLQTMFSISVLYSNEIVCFFYAGIVPLLFYQIIVRLVSRMSIQKYGVRADVACYSLSYFFIIANVVIFAIKFLYIAFPYISGFGNIVIDFVCYGVCFVFYLLFICKNLMEKHEYANIVSMFSGCFLVAFGILTLINLFY